MKTKELFFCVTVLLMAFLVACSPVQQAPKDIMEKTANTGNSAENAAKGNTVDVSLKSFKFVPVDANVKVGDTVVWTNRDVPHTVTSSDGTLDSDQLAQGDTYSHTFTKPGKYDYHCSIHPSMRGSVTVQ